MAGLQGRILGGFQLAERIGSGSIAEVYRGRPRAGGRDVVVKVIYPEFARQPGFLANFQQIVQFSAKLANHPHILPLVASGEENGYLFLVTPFVDAGTLTDALRQGVRLGATDAAPFFRQLCGALAYAHSLGIVHGNLKPGNIFLFEGRHVLLGDFGMLWDVRQLDMDHTGSGTEAVEYLAPEAFQGQTTQLSDIYSLGAVLFATLTGRAPFQGSKPADIFAAARQQPTPHLTQADPTLVAPVTALDAIVQRAMAKRPDDRYPSASAVAQAIDVTLQSAGGPLAAGQQSAALPWGAQQTPQSMNGFNGMNGNGINGVNGPSVYPPLGSQPMGGPPMGPGMAGPFMGGIAGPGMPGGAQMRLDPPFPPLPPTQRADEQMESGRIMPQRQPPVMEDTMRVPAPADRRETIGGAFARSNANIPRVTSDAPDQPTTRMPAPPPPMSPDAGGYPPPPMMPAIRPGAGWQPPDWAQEMQQAPHDAALHHNTPFSATQLGLPRLTTPALDDMPDGWDGSAEGDEQARSGEWARSNAGSYSSEYDAAPRAGRSDSRWDDSRESAAYSSAYAAPSRGSWAPDETGESRAYAAEHARGGRGRGGRDDYERGGRDGYERGGRYGDDRYDDDRYGDDPWRSLETGSAEMPGFLRARERQARDRRDPAYRDSFESPSFASERVWTHGTITTRALRRRRRRVTLFATMLLLLLFVSGGLVVYARPDLCPVSVCARASVFAHRYVPSIGGLGAASASALAISPAAVPLSVAAGGSAAAKLTITNSGPLALNWQASSSLVWLTTAPASGTLPPGASATLALTAKPQAAVTAGSYPATITLTVGQQNTTAHASVTVSAGQ